MTPSAPCPCGSGRAYRACCRNLLKGRPAPTPERLMRSRYTAYAIGHVAHVMRSTHPESPHRGHDARVWRDELRAYCAATTFTGLEILSAPPPAGAEGTVHFRASFEVSGRAHVQEERSRFRKHDGRWTYVDGLADDASA